jgi:hypothetical protein
LGLLHDLDDAGRISSAELAALPLRHLWIGCDQPIPTLVPSMSRCQPYGCPSVPLLVDIAEWSKRGRNRGMAGTLGGSLRGYAVGAVRGSDSMSEALDAYGGQAKPLRYRPHRTGEPIRRERASDFIGEDEHKFVRPGLPDTASRLGLADSVTPQQSDG